MAPSSLCLQPAVTDTPPAPVRITLDSGGQDTQACASPGDNGRTVGETQGALVPPEEIQPERWGGGERRPGATPLSGQAETQGLSEHPCRPWASQDEPQAGRRSGDLTFPGPPWTLALTPSTLTPSAHSSSTQDTPTPGSLPPSLSLAQRCLAQRPGQLAALRRPWRAPEGSGSLKERAHSSSHRQEKAESPGEARTA